MSVAKRANQRVLIVDNDQPLARGMARELGARGPAFAGALCGPTPPIPLRALLGPRIGVDTLFEIEDAVRTVMVDEALARAKSLNGAAPSRRHPPDAAVLAEGANVGLWVDARDLAVFEAAKPWETRPLGKIPIPSAGRDHTSELAEGASVDSCLTSRGRGPRPRRLQGGYP